MKNITLVFQEKIAALDEQMKVLNEKFDAASNEERDDITAEIYEVARKTNRLLRIIGADESEMYDI